MENLINSSSTSSNNGTSSLFYIGIGLSAVLLSSTSADPNQKGLSSNDLIAIERGYNPPMQFSTDEYIEATYKIKTIDKVVYNSIDFSFIDLTQQFAQEQIALDSDFTGALDELLQSKINNKPTKRRF